MVVDGGGDGGDGGDDEHMTGQVPHSLMQSCPAIELGDGSGSVF